MYVGNNALACCEIALVVVATCEVPTLIKTSKVTGKVWGLVGVVTSYLLVSSPMVPDGGLLQ